MPLHFFSDTIADTGDSVTLTGTEAHHAVAVRRLRIGEQVTIGDGRGLWLEAECTEIATRDRVTFAVLSRRTVPRNTLTIGLAQALAKTDRDEIAVAAATELGADLIIPWAAARSVSRWQGEKQHKGRMRWAGIVREASKQSHRAWLPEVAAVHSTAELAAQVRSHRTLVLDPAATCPLSSLRFDTDTTTSGAGSGAVSTSVLIVVGPEGGIDPRELDMLVAAGAESVRLGETVLRTSTAGPAALAVLNAVLGRW